MWSTTDLGPKVGDVRNEVSHVVHNTWDVTTAKSISQTIRNYNIYVNQIGIPPTKSPSRGDKSDKWMNRARDPLTTLNRLCFSLRKQAGKIVQDQGEPLDWQLHLSKPDKSGY